MWGGGEIWYEEVRFTKMESSMCPRHCLVVAALALLLGACATKAPEEEPVPRQVVQEEEWKDCLPTIKEAKRWQAIAREAFLGNGNVRSCWKRESWLEHAAVKAKSLLVYATGGENLEPMPSARQIKRAAADVAGVIAAMALKIEKEFYRGGTRFKVSFNGRVAYVTKTKALVDGHHYNLLVAVGGKRRSVEFIKDEFERLMEELRPQLVQRE